MEDKFLLKKRKRRKFPIINKSPNLFSESKINKNKYYNVENKLKKELIPSVNKKKGFILNKNKVTVRDKINVNKICKKKNNESKQNEVENSINNISHYQKIDKSIDLSFYNKNYFLESQKRNKKKCTLIYKNKKKTDNLFELNKNNYLNILNWEAKYSKTIKFEVDSWSSYISNFHPKNISLDSKISGHLSKWSVDFKSQNEFVYLKLEKTSIISSITFGKFRDPTNLKEFKILAGLDKFDMIEILHSGLSFDNENEPFSVKKDYKGLLIPCK